MPRFDSRVLTPLPVRRPRASALLRGLRHPILSCREFRIRHPAPSDSVRLHLHLAVGQARLSQSGAHPRRIGPFEPARAFFQTAIEKALRLPPKQACGLLMEISDAQHEFLPLRKEAWSTHDEAFRQAVFSEDPYFMRMVKRREQALKNSERFESFE